MTEFETAIEKLFNKMCVLIEDLKRETKTLDEVLQELRALSEVPQWIFGIAIWPALELLAWALERGTG